MPRACTCGAYETPLLLEATYNYRQRSQCQGRVRVERRRVCLRGTRLESSRPLCLCLSVCTYVWSSCIHNMYTHSLSLTLTPSLFLFLFLSFSLSLSHVLDYQEPPGRSSACVVTSVTGKQPHQAIQTENFRHHRNCWRLLIVSRL